MKRLALLVPLLALALAGFGCKQEEPKPATVPNAVTPTADTKVTQETPQGVSRDVLYARQVLRNLSQAKAFRAGMIVPSASGRITTNLDFNRDIGMSGRIELPTTQGIQTADIYATEKEIWYRNGTSSWSDLSQTQDGKNFQAVFQNAFSYSNQYQSTVSDTATLIAKTEDPSAGCQRYAFSQTLNDGTKQNFTLCISQDLPVYLTIDGPFGQIEVRYRDINGNVIVKRPV